MDMNESFGEQFASLQQNGVPNGGGNNCHQYCLKWNNHKLNVSGVFDRLRATQQFCDLTLSSADKRNIKCHRILLCAGSGYLEEILTENPSEHPTIVLSQINYEELKHLVDFMYSGEVAVETDKLGKLLEAARILKIKGLWESGLDETNDGQKIEEDVPSLHADQSSSIDEALQNHLMASALHAPKHNDTTLGLMKQGKSKIDSTSAISGSQKRKRKSNSQHTKSNSDHNKNDSILEQLSRGNVDLLAASTNKIPRLPSPSPSTSSNHSSASSPASSILSPNSLSAKSPPALILPNTPISLSSANVVDLAKSMQQYGPMFGVSNAYFLTQPPPLNMIADNNSTGGSLRSSKSSDVSSHSSTDEISNKLAGLTSPLPPKTIDKLLKDIPKLLAQTPLSSSTSTMVPSSISSSATSNAILQGNIMPPYSTSNNILQNNAAEISIQQTTKTTNSKSKGTISKKETDSTKVTSSKTNITSPTLPGLISKVGNQLPLTTGEVLANGLQLSVAPVRRYKQYTEETLQQALREIMEGQSINRSSMKYNIPARTLRDWMKRLNIKSVFTHNHSNSSSSASSSTSSNPNHGKSSETPSSSENTKSLLKNNISVTSVQEPGTTVAIKDINKLRSTNGNANISQNESDCDNDYANTHVKLENEDVDDDTDGPSIQDKELIEKILKKASLAQSSSNSSHTTSSAVTKVPMQLQKEMDSHSSSTMAKTSENEEDEEEEEIDDDEEAL